MDLARVEHLSGGSCTGADLRGLFRRQQPVPEGTAVPEPGVVELEAGSPDGQRVLAMRSWAWTATIAFLQRHLAGGKP